MTHYTTLNAIRAHRPCEPGWQKLLAGLGKTKADDEPLSFTTILDINGLDDALWATRAAPHYDKDWRLFAVWCARSVAHLSSDWRITHAINIAERYAHGMASADQLAAARAAARDAARDAAWAAWAAGDAAGAAAGDAAWDAARDAALAARDAAWDAARDAALAAWDAQEKQFRVIVA